MEGKTAFVTGGTGFVGMNIAWKLLSEGWRVIMYARKAPAGAFLEELSQLSGQIYFEKGNILDQDRMKMLLNKYRVDYFVHGAAITPDEEMEKDNPVTILEVNCIGVLRAVLAAKEAEIKRFLYLGSISAYGSTASQKEMLDEGKDIADPRSLYELSKFTGERALLQMKKLLDLDAAVARIGDVYGPWERHTDVRSHMSLVYQATESAIKGRSISIPRPCLQDWVSGPDIAGEVQAILETKTLKYDIYPFCSGTRWTLEEWCELLQKRYPDFSYSVAKNPEEASIQVNQKCDNAPMDLKRLHENTGYCPQQDSVEKAFECYMNWLDNHPNFMK